MAEREACADVVASVTAELQKDKQNINDTEKTVVVKKTTSTAKVSEGDGDEEDSDEYEIIEEIIEVTDDDDEDDNSKEEDEVEEGEDDQNKSDKKITTTTKTTTTKISEVKSDQDKSFDDSSKVKKDNIQVVVEKHEEVKPAVNKQEYSQTTDSGQQGESLLIPLLQGLLHKNMPQTSNQTANQTNISSNNKNRNIGSNYGSSGSSGTSLNSNCSSISNTTSVISSSVRNNPSHSDMDSGYSANLGVHPVEDSGTESGEDLKLIAAGLRNSMQMQNQSEGKLIEDVTAALTRLEASLKEGKDIQLDSGKRNALLTLVGRLQTGLVSPDKITAPTPAPGQNPSVEQDRSSPEGDSRKGGPRSSGHQRFAKRRTRASRHTVGVSREELADARRYIEEMVMRENMSNCTTPESNIATPPEFPYPIEKQGSTGSILSSEKQETTLYRPNQFVPEHLKDTTTFTAETTVQMRDKKPQYKAMRQSLSVEQKVDEDLVAAKTSARRPLSEAYSLDVQPGKPIQQPQVPTSILKQPSRQPEEDESVRVQQTVYEKNLYNKIHHSNRPAWAPGPVQSNFQTNPSNPSNPWNPSHSSNPSNPWNPSNPSNPSNPWNPSNSANPSNPWNQSNSGDQNSLGSNKFSNKKLMMKRANTIDIPKPMRYINEMDSDSEAEAHGVNSIKGIGLRGTVQVSVRAKPRQVVPVFQPKTENDHKFLAFIQKQSPSSNLSWNNPNKNSNASNWSNRFGNIIHSFETAAVATSSKPPMPTSVARNFWKKNDTGIPDEYQGKISKPNEKVVRPPWADKPFEGDVTYQKIKDAPRVKPESPKIKIPKSAPLNQFSHAPMSAFKPISPIKNEPIEFNSAPPEPETYSEPIQNYHQTYSEPIQNYSPRPPQASPTKGRPLYTHTLQNRSPILPWAGKLPSENRVNQTAAKFDKSSPTNVPTNGILQRHHSLRMQDQMYNDRMETYEGSRLVQKRPSLPNTAQYMPDLNAPHMVQSYQNTHHMNGNAYTPPIQPGYQPMPYTSTDYTQPSNISTYAPEPRISRSDSLTNPQSEPIVLTSHRPIISPSNRPKEPLKIFDYQSSSENALTPPTSPNYTQNTDNDISDDDLDTDCTEYKAESKVMRGPVTQQAVTVTHKTHNRMRNEEKGSKAAKSLLSSMKSISTSKTEPKDRSGKVSPKVSISPDGRSYLAPKVDPAFPALVNQDGKPKVSQSVQQPAYQQSYPQPYAGYQQPSPGDKPDAYRSVAPGLPVYQQNPAYIPPASPQTLTQYATQEPMNYNTNHAYVPPASPSFIGKGQEYKAYQQPSPQPYIAPSSYQQSQSQSPYQSQPQTPVYQPPQSPAYQPSSQSPAYQQPPQSPAYQMTPQSPAYQMPPQSPAYPQPPVDYHSQPPSNYGQSPTMPKYPPNYQPPAEYQQAQSTPTYQAPPPTYQPPPPTYQPPPATYQPPPATYQPPADYSQSQPPASYKPPASYQPPPDYSQTQPPATYKQPASYQPPVDYSQTQPPASYKQPASYQPPVDYSQTQPPASYKQSVTKQASADYTYSRSAKSLKKQTSFEKPQPTVQPVGQAQAFYQQQYTAPVETSKQGYAPKKESKVSSQKTVTYKTETTKKVKSSVTTAEKSVTKPKLMKQAATESKYKVTVPTTPPSPQARTTQSPTFTMPSYQKNLTLKKQHSQPESFSAPQEKPTKKDKDEKDESIPILKKFGPAQPHSYHPNSYQYAGKPATGGGLTSRKFSEPTLKTVTATATASASTIISQTVTFGAPDIVETPATPAALAKSEIPANIVMNNIGQFTAAAAARRTVEAYESEQGLAGRLPLAVIRANPLSKSDSWHQICQQAQAAKPPSPKGFGSEGGHQLRRVKSGHTLSLPKMYEGVVQKSELEEKQRTVAAYFSGQKSPTLLSRNNSLTHVSEAEASRTVTTSSKKTSINRIKTSHKASISKQSPSSGLMRSQTMPHISLLDESNVEDAFEELMKNS